MNPQRINSHNESSWPFFALGSFLLLHFVIICAIKTSQGYHADIFWMSHVALALAGAGFLLNSRLLIGAALTSIAYSHLLWLFDFCVAQFTHAHPLWITQYLDAADSATWVATLHHFYLLPLLLLVIRRVGVYRLDSFVLAVILTIATTLVSRALLPEARNVNWAFAIMPRANWGILQAVNALPAAAFLVALLLWQTFVMLLPAALLLRWGTRRYAVASTRDTTEIAAVARNKKPRRQQAV